jgi:hypothetical protein
MSFFKFIIIVLLFSSSGCATSRHGADPAITKWPLDVATHRKTIEIQFKYCNNTEKCPNDIIKANEKAYGPVAKAYESSGLFTVLKSGLGNADLTIVVNVADNSGPSYLTKERSGVLLAKFCVASIFIIPCFIEKSTMVESEFFDSSGKLIASFKRDESSYDWIGWPTILAAPLYYPESVKEEIIYDLNRNTIIEAHSKGIF